jgi:tetratricopeptide (TPR) repeat protein
MAQTVNNSYLQTGRALFTQLDINLDEVPFEQLSNYTAVEYFLTVEDEPSSDTTNLEKVKRYLESFHHLCKVEDWERANYILFSGFNKPSNQSLTTLLHSWGYHTERIELHNQLLGKLNDQVNVACLRNLGNSYMLLGQHEKTINLYQESLILARKIGDRHGEWSTLRVLSNFYYSRGDYSKAIEFYEHFLSLSEILEEPQGKAEALMALAGANHFLGKAQKAIKLFDECFAYIQTLDNQPKKIYLLGSLGNMFNLIEEYDKAIDCYRQSLSIAEIINYQQIGGDLLNLGYSRDTRKMGHVVKFC